MHTEKVIWKDGLFVLPQHFQQFERYVLDIMQRTYSAAIPYMYGFTSCAIDLSLLSKGKFALSEAQGIMPDGIPFSMPLHNTIPSIRSVEEHFGRQKNHLDVYLTLPLAQEGKPACSDGASAFDTRYKTDVIALADEVSGDTSEEIEIGKCNFIIRFEGESLDAVSSLRVARLKRTVNEGISIDESISPTIVSIAASSVYLKKIETLLSELHTKAGELFQGRKQLAQGFAVFTPEEMANHYLLTNITTYTPLLDQLFRHASQVHPYVVYSLIGTLAGALQALGKANEITALPEYEHFDPCRSLDSMLASIYAVLRADYSARCMRLPLEKTAEATYACTITDKTLLTKAEFFLGLAADASHEILIDAARRAIKMTSRDQLQRLTIAAMPGLRLNAIMNPPSDLATKKDFVYFSLVREGNHWQNIQTAGNIAFYFPNNLSGLNIELLAVKMR
jgi:type VI secretion system protein ImpJ